MQASDMNRRRVPLSSTSSYTNTISTNREDVNPTHNLKLERVLKDISFLRISIDSIAFPEENQTIARLIQDRALFGFSLDYQFPCPDGVSSLLKTKVRINAKEYSSTGIVFKHKRVLNIKMDPSVIPCWQRAELFLQLSIQIDTHGKYATRPLASCRVPLSDLVLPPFLVSRDFPFVGQNFEGFALVRIDLGSKNKTLMEQIEEMRGIETPILDDGSGHPPPPGPPQRARSRSSSRCRSRSERSPSPPRRRPNSVSSLPSSFRHPSPPPLIRAPIPSWNSSQEDDVFLPTRSSATHSGTQRSILSTSRSRLMGNNHVEISPRDPLPNPRKSVIRLTIHGANHLPSIIDRRNRLNLPNTFLSVRGRDGELRSLTVEGSCPRWEWTAQFAVSGERRNLVIKLIHMEEGEVEKPLGFVSLSLPVTTVSRSDFEVVDLTGRAHAKVPTLNLTAEQVPDPVPSVLESEKARERVPSRGSRHEVAGSVDSRGSSRIGDHYTVRRRSPSPLIEDTREDIERRLRRNLSELDHLMDQIHHR